MQASSGSRSWTAILGAACAAVAFGAQAQAVGSGAWDLTPSGKSQGAIGLQPGKVRVSIGCGASLLPCRDEDAALAAQARPGSLRWSMELGTLNLGPAARVGPTATRQGLNLSLVGRRPLLGSNFSVYGKLGTTYGATESGGSGLPAALAAPESGYGVSFGAGVSMDVTPRLSATLGWDTHELRLGGGPRDSVRATSLGLQYRY